MYTYEVWVKSQKYQGKSPLTYTSLERLEPGTVVNVDLRKSQVAGFIRREAAPPKNIAMKPIDGVLLGGEYLLPREHLQLFSWILQYYPAGSGSIAQLFLPVSMPKKIEIPESTPPKKIISTLPPLTKEQASALKTIRKQPGSFLLHGNTGSGKTRIYTELIKDSLRSGRSALVLVPEIGLTPHIAKQLSDTFGSDTITIFHSGLTPAKRRQAWLKILTTRTPQIVVGPRSVLFAPLHNIGLVVVDECHDDGYKQDNTPHYHGLRVASQLARFHDATLIFGSATPSINDVYIANRKDIPILRLTKTAKKNTTKVRTVVVDKKIAANFNRSQILSNQLLRSIEQQLKTNQQSLLFLNRRGSARVIMCRECGWRALCRHCDLPLTLHEDTFQLRCHTCEFNQPSPTSCPECQNHEIVFFGPGTKAIEKEVQRLFPNARVARFDGDNLTNDSLENHLESILGGSIDIIVGTQVLIKGFDIPRLGLVGLVDADSSLSFPDFATEEHTYQIINQAIGRVGRGHVDGTIVVQTLQPDNPVLNQAITKDWDTFYTYELKRRKEHDFPPFTFLLKLECARKSRTSAVKAATNLRQELESNNLPITILGPTPAFNEKNRDNFTWQLIIKSPRRSALLEVIKQLPSGWKYNIDPTHLL